MLCLTGNKEARDGVFFSFLFSSQSRLDGLEKCFSSKLLSVGSANRADLKLILLSAAARTSFKRFVRYELVRQLQTTGASGTRLDVDQTGVFAPPGVFYCVGRRRMEPVQLQVV